MSQRDIDTSLRKGEERMLTCYPHFQLKDWYSIDFAKNGNLLTPGRNT